MTRISAIFIFSFIFQAKGQYYSAEDEARLPRLFHLDDYDRCLRQKNGLYCLGKFELSPIEPSPTYDLIQTYSDTHTFNRSRLHRGYCVSTRCPLKPNERNATLSFERCVNERAKQFALSAHLHTFGYCTTHEEYKIKLEESPDSERRLFQQIIYAFLILNFVGTVYDLMTADKKEKNGLLVAWSVRANWRRLTATYNDGDPRLKQLEPLHGLRVLIMLMVMFCHCLVMHYQGYVTNPIYLENLIYGATGLFFANGTSGIQIFVMMSSFLITYNMLVYSEKHEVNVWTLTVVAIKRIIRTAPVHLLLVGYSLSWWPHARSGALHYVIKGYSESCKRKFWWHALFLNNVVERSDMCLPPTWYIAVDMHLFIVTFILNVLMHRRRQQALRFYGAMYVLSAVMCGIVGYVREYESLVNLGTPELARAIAINTKVFKEYHTSTWGAVPACLLGMFMANLHYELQERKYNYSQNGWLHILTNWTFPAFFVWNILSGVFMRHNKHPLIVATCMTVERSVLYCFMFILLFGTVNVRGKMQAFYSWRWWRIPARLGLPLMLCHWVIIQIIVLRPAAYETSLFVMTSDYVTMLFFTFLICIPISLLVEIPVQRFFAQLF